MEGKLITKTGRIFPVNLYNKLEAKLKEDKKEEPVQAEPAKEPDMNLIKCPKCGKMVERDRVKEEVYMLRMWRIFQGKNQQQNPHGS